MGESGPTLIDPMPCGFVREGVRLRERLKHYRVCAHPACQERARAADELRKAIAAGIRKE